MFKVRLGNPAPHESYRDNETDALVTLPIEGPSVTTVEIPHDSVLVAVREIEDLWKHHGAEPPSWVAADNEGLEVVLAGHFGCRRGEPSAKTGKGAAK